MDTSALATAQDTAREVLAGVGPEQLELPTPCAEWNVAQLIDHLVGAQLWAAAGIRGAEMDETGEGSAAGDFAAAFDRAASGALAAFREPGALDRTVNAGFGDMPATALMGLAVTDTLTHAWDLARATGQDTDLAPELAEAVLAQSHQTLSESFRSEEGSIFGPEQPAPEGATAADRLAAFLGRTA